MRPEAYGGLVHHRIANKVDEYPVHAEVLNSTALREILRQVRHYLLSHLYPEGAPIHSTYPGGASQIAASNVTILKAFFDENAVIENPVQPDPADPTRLIPYVGEPLTVGGELNKLAWNYGVGRDWAGIHWRSDFSASLALGEELAISLLRDERPPSANASTASASPASMDRGSPCSGRTQRSSTGGRRVPEAESLDGVRHSVSCHLL